MRGRAANQTLSEPPAGIGGNVRITTALAWAVVLGVGEGLVRFALADHHVEAPELTLAILLNVACLGLIALGVTCVARALGWCLKTALPSSTRNRSYDPAAFHLAILVVTLLAFTECLGFVSQWSIVPMAAVAIAGVVTALAHRKLCDSSTRFLTTFARGAVAVAWVFCVGASMLVVTKTQSHVDRWLDVQTPTRMNPADGKPAEQTANIVLLVLDTLRADRVGVYGGGKLTPNLDRLAESSIVYSKALSTAPWTLPAHASLFTGLYPDRHGVNWGHYKLEDEEPVLAELLQEQGYQTFAVSNNWLLSQENGFARGFDTFIETSRDPVLSKWRLALQCGVGKVAAGYVGLSRDTGYDAGSGWTNWLMRSKIADHLDGNRPFFAFVNYFEVHDPYRPLPRYQNTLLSDKQRERYPNIRQSESTLAAQACGVKGVYDEEDIALLSALYDAEVAYQDETVGQLLTMLEENGRLDDTWVIVTSDHGELFGEGTGLYHTAGSHFKLLHVPLIVRPPGGTKGRQIDALVQPVDVFATLLHVADAPLPSSVEKTYRLPISEDDPAQRSLCIAQTHGASIAGLAMAQRADLQADFSGWLRWIDSVYDGRHLLEMNNDQPTGLYDVTADSTMSTNLLKQQPGLTRLLATSWRDWSEELREGDHPWRWARRVNGAW